MNVDNSKTEMNCEGKTLRRTSRKHKAKNFEPKDKCENKGKLSKYRQKCANAKERERMKKVNTSFDTLKSMLPFDLMKQNEQEKDTKVCMILFYK